MKASWVCCSDLQLNKTYTHSKNIPCNLLGFEGIWNMRLADRVKNFKECTDFAIEKKVDFFVIAGDIFDKLNPGEDLKALFVRMIKPLVEAKIKTFLIIGNHDTDGKAFNLSSEEEIMNLSDLGDMIKVIEKPWVHSKGDFKLCMYPWNNENEEVMEFFKTLGPGHIIFAHLPIQGAVLGAHETLDKFGLEALLFKDQKKVYAGHYHRHQLLGKNVYYTGSLARQDFGERDDDKGFMYSYVDDSNEIVDKFIKIHDRPFIQFEIRQDQIDVFEQIQMSELSGAILKIRFIGDEIWYHAIDKKRATIQATEKGAIKIFIEWVNSTQTQLRTPEVTVDSKFEHGVEHFLKTEKRTDLTDLALGILKDVQEISL